MIETMSLKEMMNYKGRQAVPSDIDSFWKMQKEKLPEQPEYTLKKKNLILILSIAMN